MLRRCHRKAKNPEPDAEIGSDKLPSGAAIQSHAVTCGLIAQYNTRSPFPGPDRLPLVMDEVLTKRLTIRGFIVTDLGKQRPAFYAEMGQWVRDGQVRYREDIVEGLEKAPAAFIGLLQGHNFGKLLVRVANGAG